VQILLNVLEQRLDRIVIHQARLFGSFDRSMQVLRGLRQMECLYQQKPVFIFIIWHVDLLSG